MPDQPLEPADVEALPIEQRAAAYLEAQRALEVRSQLPGT